jgi:hypothetical protein
MTHWLAAWILTAAVGTPPDSLHRPALDTALAAFSAAFARADAAALDTLLTADYVHTNGGTGAVLDKSRWLEYIRARRVELETGRLRLDRYETKGVDVRLSPPVAIVTSEVATGGVRDGSRFTSRLRVTQVWVYRERRWRRAAFHDSPVSGA